MEEKIENASTGVQVVVSLDKLVRDFESEKDGVASSGVEMKTISNRRRDVGMLNEPVSFICGVGNFASNVTWTELGAGTLRRYVRVYCVP